jgi:hypothetical protein
MTSALIAVAPQHLDQVGLAGVPAILAAAGEHDPAKSRPPIPQLRSDSSQAILA